MLLSLSYLTYNLFVYLFIYVFIYLLIYLFIYFLFILFIYLFLFIIYYLFIIIIIIAISNKVYYYNSETGESSYDRPSAYITPRTDEGSYWDEYSKKDNEGPEEVKQNDYYNEVKSAWVKYWEESEGYEFYYNAATGESVFERPNDYYTPRSDGVQFDKLYDANGNEYYYNKADGSSSYERPNNFFTPR